MLCFPPCRPLNGPAHLHLLLLESSTHQKEDNFQGRSHSISVHTQGLSPRTGKPKRFPGINKYPRSPTPNISTPRAAACPKSILAQLGNETAAKASGGPGEADIHKAPVCGLDRCSSFSLTSISHKVSSRSLHLVGRSCHTRGQQA